MKRFVTSLTAFFTGLNVVPSFANSMPTLPASRPILDPPMPVTLRPLNLPGDNLFAGHRSHSSHSSHRSHRSSSGGGTTYRAPARTQPSAPSSLYGSGSSNPTDPGRAAIVSPTPAKPQTQLSDAEKKKLQVMRVQLALTSLGLYSGSIDGVLGPETRESITFFQRVKDLTPSGKMTSETLTALGVMAVK